MLVKRIAAACARKYRVLIFDCPQIRFHAAADVSEDHFTKSPPPIRIRFSTEPPSPARGREGIVSHSGARGTITRPLASNLSHDFKQPETTLRRPLTIRARAPRVANSFPDEGGAERRDGAGCLRGTPGVH